MKNTILSLDLDNFNHGRYDYFKDQRKIENLTNVSVVIASSYDKSHSQPPARFGVLRVKGNTTNSTRLNRNSYFFWSHNTQASSAMCTKPILIF